MGKYVKKGDELCKIGTCENLYYTTYSELDRLVKNGEADGSSYLKKDSGDRFRFPFPDEDHVLNFGEYDDYDRGVLFCFPKTLGVGICHGETFYRTDEKIKNAPPVGFRLPCVMSEEFKTQKFDWYNTNNGTIFEVVQQKYVTDEETEKEMFHIVVRCPYCGDRSRISLSEMQSILNYARENETKFTELQRDIIKIAWEGYNIV